MKKKIKLPPIGMRIIKSAVAVAICYFISFLRGDSGIVFYSELAALWCIQVYVSNTRRNAVQRFIGTVIGAAYGLVFLLLFSRTPKSLNAILVSLFIVAILYSTVLIKKKEASYFSCVVFLSIVVNHMSDANPYLFVWNRFLDTVIGIAIGVAVNIFTLPRKKNKDILFISGLDDTLLHTDDNLSDYSKVELNRMLDEGLMFTISTIRTPASLMEPLKDIRLKLPVIAMDGAVLYDTRELRYLKAYVISNCTSRSILQIIRDAGLKCYINVILDNVLVIYHEDTDDEVNNSLVREMRKSPFRNYIRSCGLGGEDVVYFMLLYPKNIIENFYHILLRYGVDLECKILKYDSVDYPGYSYIKIYNKNASKEHMLQYLKEMLDVKNTVTFGSVEGKYDVVIEPGDTNRVVRDIKKMYEPVSFMAAKKKEV